MDVGGFPVGSTGARMTILLHELAHKVLPPDFIYNDSTWGWNPAKPGTSEKNTQTVADHCFNTILDAVNHSSRW